VKLDCEIARISGYNCWMPPVLSIRGTPDALPSSVSVPDGGDERNEHDGGTIAAAGNDMPPDLAAASGFLYRSVEFDRVSQEVLTAIVRRDRFLTLTGPEGVGKTTLVEAILEQLDRRTLACSIDRPFGSAKGLLQTMLVDLGIATPASFGGDSLIDRTGDDLLSVLRTFIRSLAAIDAYVLVIVDHAEHLTSHAIADLQLLTDIDSGDARLQVLLVGESGLDALLDSPHLQSLRHGLEQRSRLGPLTAVESREYVIRRLDAVAGIAPGVELDEEALDKMSTLAGGVPGTLDVLVASAVVQRRLRSAPRIDAAMVDPASEFAELLPAARPISRRFAVVTIAMLLLAGAALAAFLMRGDVSALVSRIFRT